jgi:anti-anti-sigma factor
MNFQYDEDATGIIVRMSGDLNFAANGEFKAVLDKLAAAKGRLVTFDLANVPRIDSVGLGLLYIAREEVGAKIRLKSPQGNIVKMLELTEADADFDIQR